MVDGLCKVIFIAWTNVSNRLLETLRSSCSKNFLKSSIATSVDLLITELIFGTLISVLKGLGFFMSCDPKLLISCKVLLSFLLVAYCSSTWNIVKIQLYKIWIGVSSQSYKRCSSSLKVPPLSSVLPQLKCRTSRPPTRRPRQRH